MVINGIKIFTSGINVTGLYDARRMLIVYVITIFIKISIIALICGFNILYLEALGFPDYLTGLPYIKAVLKLVSVGRPIMYSIINVYGVFRFGQRYFVLFE